MKIIHDDLEFFNVGELLRIDGHEGLRVQRVPETLRMKLNENAQQRMLIPVNVEIRFVLEPGEELELTLSSTAGAMTANVFWGNVLQDGIYRINEEPTTLKLSLSERALAIGRDQIEEPPFAWNVCRVMLKKTPTYGDGNEFYYHGHTGAKVRPPNKDEAPTRNWLAYGTSITQGSVSSAPYLSWVGLTARELGVNLINLGSGGSCHCEPEKADYMAGLEWDFATLCLSVNMVGSFEEEEFRKRVRYVVDKISAAKPEAPVFCITLMTFHADWLKDNEKTNSFRNILEEIVAELARPNLYLIDGRELILSPSEMAGDFIHPSDFGMMKISQRILERIQPILEGS